MLLFNFCFTEPRLTLHAYERGYPVTFAIMLIVSIITVTLAIQNIRNAEEKERAAVRAKNEQLRADLLRTISHDLRTPLTSISGNASNLISNYEKMDDPTRKQTFLDIYDDSMWLINLVENILSISRIEDGRMNLSISTELVSEVFEEALRHTNRHSGQHTITVQMDDDLLLAEYGATVVGMEMLRDHTQKIEIEARKKATVQIALATLSYSEVEAAINILGELNGTEGLLVASKIADRVGITRSVIVNALRKFESAGVIESKSLGMKGTYIKVLNEHLLEEVQKLKH